MSIEDKHAEVMRSGRATPATSARLGRDYRSRASPDWDPLGIYGEAAYKDFRNTVAEPESLQTPAAARTLEDRENQLISALKRTKVTTVKSSCTYPIKRYPNQSVAVETRAVRQRGPQGVQFP